MKWGKYRTIYEKMQKGMAFRVPPAYCNLYGRIISNRRNDLDYLKTQKKKEKRHQEDDNGITIGKGRWPYTLIADKSRNTFC